jgi:hypothetical protein
VRIDNYKDFCSQLEEVVIEYPGLTIGQKGDLKYVKGVLDIYNDKGAVAGSYLMEICFTEHFPFQFPKLYETGQAIPNEADWHKYPDGSCCLTVRPDEIIICKAGITVSAFIKNFCIPFFANHIYRKLEGKYKNGEYAHGVLGLAQYYNGLLRTSDKVKWQKYFDHVFGQKIFKLKRNELCFCGSSVKYKRCHLIIFKSMWDIGSKRIWSDFKLIDPFFN